jgi:predicted RNA binding protein YcfA (HicA-like mRNA interferase family)
MDSAKLIKQLKADGFVEVSVRGSHHKLRNESTGRTVIVPHPKKDLPMGTVQSIFRQAGWRK